MPHIFEVRLVNTIRFSLTRILSLNDALELYKNSNLLLM